MNSTEVSSVEAALKKGEREKALETLVDSDVNDSMLSVVVVVLDCTW